MIDGSDLEVFARGVRNSMGFDWHPITGDFWFTENGADNLGDNRPDDVLYRATGPGLNFGFPFCHIRVHHNPSTNLNTLFRALVIHIAGLQVCLESFVIRISEIVVNVSVTL